MGRLGERATRRHLRHRRIRKKVIGFPERPRLSVFRSHKHVYVQLIDDVKGQTIFGCSTQAAKLKDRKTLKKTEVTAELGKLVGAEAKKRGIDRVVFDRGGFLYHGRVKAVAEALRSAGVNV